MSFWQFLIEKEKKKNKKNKEQFIQLEIEAPNRKEYKKPEEDPNIIIIEL